MFYLLLGVGLIGLIGMTLLFPCLAGLYCYFFGKKNATGRVRLGSASSISILIPAHNEQESLDGTLRSITESIACAKSNFPSTDFVVRVGLDGCSDGTEQIASRFGCDVVSTETSRGKWKTLHALIERSSESEYVVLADAGVIWPNNFLSLAVSKLTSMDLVALAPTYRNPSRGLLESLLWSVERSLKDIEAHSGGPVSVHGATIIYDTKAVLQAFEKVSHTTWLNDDVVIPLVVRALNPSRKLLYCPELGVADADHAVFGDTQHGEFGRRRRMVIGNVQWMRRILPILWQASTVVGLLSLRRVFRVFWAYWGLACACALAILFGHAFGLAALTIFAALFVACAAMASHRIGSIRRIFDAAGASLMAPYYFCRLSSSTEAVWA